MGDEAGLADYEGEVTDLNGRLKESTQIGAVFQHLDVGAQLLVPRHLGTQLLDVLGRNVQRHTRSIGLRWSQGIRQAKARRAPRHHGSVSTVNIEVQPLRQVLIEIFVDTILRIYEIL